MTDRELMQQALSTLEGWAGHGKWVWPESALEQAKRNTAEAIAALRERLAQPQMQPCAGRNCGSTNPNLHSAECFEDYEKSTGMAQPEQDPVAWVCYGSASDEKHTIDYWQEDINAIPVGTMLYTAQRQWQGLTDEEIEQMMDYWSEDARSAYGGAHSANGEYVYIPDIIRDVEKRLKEKNDG